MYVAYLANDRVICGSKKVELNTESRRDDMDIRLSKHERQGRQKEFSAVECHLLGRTWSLHISS